MMLGNRVLYVTTADGPRDVEVRVEQPEPYGHVWKCQYSIGWPEAKFERRVQGGDALAAMHMALQMIGLDLNSSAYHSEGRLKWMEPWVGYGFPVPKDARDMLTGQDKEFYG